ncbi:hypothetical protein RCF98_08000 [Thiothrix lacustris]|uniref:STAS/SEC14 domain-containing protein n=1 Tax=Thiothrix lacustris TaxID=525917 RepID=A0ABY9MVK7_9GAMM|nr:hypothetical protein [Thiothrix lacustris]WML92271.1 hypothetical protein RCF98_08000 [Thiothrix lacustris]
MPTVQITTQASTEELLRSVASLPAAELEQFVTRVLALRARLKAPTIPDQEANLLRNINTGLSATQQQRFADLNHKRQEETLTDEEYQELLLLIEEMETKNVERIQNLSLLAQLRQVSLTTLMQNLGIKALPYA